MDRSQGSATGSLERPGEIGGRLLETPRGETAMNSLPSLPPEPGTYVLILHVGEGSAIQVGALGEVHFGPGFYAYVGSAQGPGGLRARILRHARHSNDRPAHWHIDYLLGMSQLNEAWCEVGHGRKECRWAEVLSNLGRCYPSRFGASDCRCAGHLLFLGAGADLERVRDWLEHHIGDDCSLCGYRAMR
jgi:Uri superfamily endonuclease